MTMQAAIPEPSWLSPSVPTAQPRPTGNRTGITFSSHTQTVVLETSPRCLKVPGLIWWRVMTLVERTATPQRSEKSIAAPCG